MKLIFKVLVTALLCVSSWVFADGGGPADSLKGQPEDPTIKAVKSAIASGDWTGAQEQLKLALVGNPNNADYHNLLAYSTRKGPNPDMALVFQHYDEALRIDPKHRGAREYLGEAYLTIDNLAKAKEQLSELDRLCFFGCEEYTDLKKAVAKYEDSRKR